MYKSSLRDIYKIVYRKKGKKAMKIYNLYKKTKYR